MDDDCTHISDPAPKVVPTGEGCEECLQIGSGWVHLRVCVACGHVGCCDQSPNRHSRAHFAQHPDHMLIRSFEPGEAWWYCWADDAAFELEGVGPLKPE